MRINKRLLCRFTNLVKLNWSDAVISFSSPWPGNIWNSALVHLTDSIHGIIPALIFSLPTNGCPPMPIMCLQTLRCTNNQYDLGSSVFLHKSPWENFRLIVHKHHLRKFGCEWSFAFLLIGSALPNITSWRQLLLTFTMVQRPVCHPPSSNVLDMIILILKTRRNKRCQKSPQYL